MCLERLQTFTTIGFSAIFIEGCYEAAMKFAMKISRGKGVEW